MNPASMTALLLPNRPKMRKTTPIMVMCFPNENVYISKTGFSPLYDGDMMSCSMTPRDIPILMEVSVGLDIIISPVKVNKIM